MLELNRRKEEEKQTKAKKYKYIFLLSVLECKKKKIYIVS